MIFEFFCSCECSVFWGHLYLLCLLKNTYTIVIAKIQDTRITRDIDEKSYN